MEGDEPQLPKWEKVLWKKQPYPDDYIDPSFLSSLRRNTNVRHYEYSALALSACAVTQHLSTIFLLVVTFIQLRAGRLDERMLVWSSIVLYPFGYALWEVMQGEGNKNEERRLRRVKATKSSILVFLILITISPVLKTLTQATSSDSIWALSASLFSLNALLADYTAAHPLAAKEPLTSVLSMNAAISASVVLASRLSSNQAVFALILFSVELFALFPILRRKIQAVAPPSVKITITALLGASATVPFAFVNVPVTVLITAILLFVNFACPAFFIWAQRYKNEIKGPWDPAVPQVRKHKD